jgi:hypothetical protein
MRLEQSFYQLQERNPYWSSYTCLANAIMGKGFGKMAIGQCFKKFVEKTDYERKDRDRILGYLCGL